MSRWLERSCNNCYAPIAYLPEWTNIPEYCPDCREWKYKDCLNSHCPGQVKYKVYWRNVSDYCECRGWYEKKCECCYHNFKVNHQWDNIPDYCSSCREWKEKSCANLHCTGKVRYKEFWGNKPEYCSCKGWYKKQCDNPHCNGNVDVHSSWSSLPRYCSCRGQYTANCANAKCRNVVTKHHDSKNQKELCDTCHKMSRRSGYVEIVKGTEMEKWLQGCKSGNVKDYGFHFHVTLYHGDGGHVSGDIDKYSTESWNVHGTLYIYDERGKKVDRETIDF